VFGAERGFIQLLISGCAVLFLGVQGVLRGYLQGGGYTKPILLSDLLIALTTMVSGTVFSILLYGYGLKVNDLFHVDEFASVYGSVGMMAGFLTGAVVGFIQILVSFQLRKNEIDDFVKSGAPRYLDNKNDVLTGIRPIVILYAAPAFMAVLDQCFYCMFIRKFHEEVDYKNIYGIFSGKILTLTVLLSILCCMPYLKSLNRVMARFERDEYEGARERFRFLVRFTNMLFMPVSVFVFATNETLLISLFGKSTAFACKLLMLGSLFIYFCSFAIIFSWLLSHMGKSVATMLNVGVGWGVHIAGLVVFVVLLNMGAYGLILSAVLAFLVYDVMCLLEISRVLSHKQEFFRSFLLPLISSAVAGLAVFLLNRLLVSLIGDVLTILLCILVYWFVYMMVMIVSRGIRVHELHRIPFGSLLMGVAAMIQGEENIAG
jgi:O-antigen/teichoic acid export membrane protein